MRPNPSDWVAEHIATNGGNLLNVTVLKALMDAEVV